MRPAFALPLAIAVTLLALFVRLMLEEVLGGRLTMVIFTVPIMVSAYAGGLLPGLLSTGVSCVLTASYLMPATDGLSDESRYQQWQLFFLALSGVVISVLNEELHRARQRAIEAVHARHATDQALQRAKEIHARRIVGIIDSAMDAIIGIDEGHGIVLFNAAAERMFACPAASALGQGLAQFFPAEVSALHRRQLGVLRELPGQSGSVQLQGPLTGLRRDGSAFPAEVSISCADVVGERIYTTVIRDVTERLQAEHSLQLSERRFQEVSERLREGLIIMDVAGDFRHWNRSALRMHGFDSLDECLQVAPSFFSTFALHTLDGEAIGAGEGPFSRLLAGERVQDRVLRIRRLDAGWERVFHYSGAVFPFGDGRTMAFMSINDVTEHHQATADLRRQLAQLRLLDDITAAIAARDDLSSIFQVTARSLEAQMPVDFSCVLETDAETRSLGVGAPELADRRLPLDGGTMLEVDPQTFASCMRGELVYHADAARTDCAFFNALRAAGLRAVVLAPLLAEQRVYGVLIVARRGSDAFGGPEREFIRQLSAHVALAARQAQLHAELHRAFDELRQTQQAATQQERLSAVGQMASGIAHDINNAVAPAMLYAESLLDHEDLGEVARAQVQSIARAMDDVAATVARLREFYRTREPEPHLVPLGLNELVVEVIELARARWSDMPEERGVVISVETDLADSPPQVLGARSEIRDALINLIFNAVDAMPRGGVLRLSTRVSYGHGPVYGVPFARAVVLEVADTGTGMDEATRRQCLEPFFTTKGDRGTGLGLAMVYGAVRRHGASLEIDTAPGGGTRVQIGLPVNEAASALAVSIASPLLAPLRVLLIDDDPAVLHALKFSLEGDGHLVHVANGGQAGIDLFAALRRLGKPPDIVLTDLGMPQVDGLQVAAAIKLGRPVTPVILLTGWGQRRDDSVEMPDQIDLVLAKPAKLGEIRSAMATLWATRTSLPH